MTAAIDPSPYGSRVPSAIDGAVLRLTRSLPANWLGLRLAMLLRRIVIARIGEGALDTFVWGIRFRLYPRRNSCEKNALFNPQMYDPVERDLLAAAVARRIAGAHAFTFVDLGANVGLYSLFVARCAAPHVRALAIEPQPGIHARLLFNVQCNPELNVDVVAAAATDRDGEVDLIINNHDSAGTRVNMDTVKTEGTETVRVPSRLLASILAEAGISSIDAMKVDIEGAEELALVPFLHAASQDLLPRLILIEDRSPYWTVDLFGLLQQLGYRYLARTRTNVAYQFNP
jgi:FkbM family methyltransferase